MEQGIHVDVYPTDAEAFEAAAALAATHLGASGARPTVALAGGRGGRGVMVALAARGDVPWDRVEWFWGDERCVRTIRGATYGWRGTRSSSRAGWRPRASIRRRSSSRIPSGSRPRMPKGW